MKTRKRITVRRNLDSSGHWTDIAAGDFIDARLKPWRSISRATFTTLVAGLLATFGVFGWLMSIQIDSEVNPRKLAQSLSPAVYEVTCGEYSGTAFAIDHDFNTGYETYLVSAAHIFEQCVAGDFVQLAGSGGVFRAKLIAKNSSLFYDLGTGSSNDSALIGATFSSQKLKFAKTIDKGDWAIAMGYPWGQDQYVSFGVVADQDSSEVFVDTPLNEGNSGGPVVNGRGEVLGIVSYYPLQSNLYPDNPDGVWDRADGIGAIKKLSNLCTLPKTAVPVCPFG